MSRGFTLLETTFAAVVLMIGTVTLISVGKNLIGQANQMRNVLGEPAIAQGLIDEEIQAIDAQRAAPAVPPAIAPLGLGASGSAAPVAIYGVQAVQTSAVGGLTCYDVTATFNGQPIQAASPSFVTNGGTVSAPAVLVCRQ